MPSTESSFVLLRHRGQHSGGERRSAHGRRQHYRTRDRIALVRHGERASTALSGWLKYLCDFCLRLQGEIASNFPQRPDEEGEKRGDLSEAVTMRMPWEIRHIQLKFLGEHPGDIQAALAEARKSTGGSAELQNENAAAQFLHAGAMPRHRVQPSCGFEPEGGRHGLLQPGSGWHDGGAMGCGELGERAAQLIHICCDDVESVAQLQNEAGIDYVLAGWAPAHVAHGLLV